MTGRVSSHCSGGSCVRVTITRVAVHVRDTKRPHGPPLSFSHREWHDFIRGVKAGEFDIPTPEEETTDG